MQKPRILHHIFPTRENGYVPHVLRFWSLLFIFCIGLGLFSFAKLTQMTGSFGLLAEVYPRVVFALTNKDRADASLSSLSYNEVLEKAAQLKANDMAASGYFAHTSPTGVTPWHWFGEAGYQFRYAGENLAVNFNESEDVQTAWLNSPTHKANIMSGNFTEIGVATAKGFYNGRETTFVVEMFGMPAITKTAAGAPISSVAVNEPEPRTSQSKAVAGESASVEEPEEIIQIIDTNSTVEDTTLTTFMTVENTDTAIVPAPVIPTPSEPIHLPWYKRLLLQGETLAGTLLTAILIILFFATAAMVARSYEKHHIKHMIGGSVMMAMLLAGLFLGRLGIFKTPASVAYTDTVIRVTQ